MNERWPWFLFIFFFFKDFVTSVLKVYKGIEVDDKRVINAPKF